MKNLIQLATLAACFASVSAGRAGDWITAPSYYTHDPATGQRIAQFSPVGPFFYQHQAGYQKSGYRHSRSTLQVGHSADNFHVVEAWGRPVRPYGEWRYPYRPYSVPYHLWGAPYAGLGYPAPYHAAPYHGRGQHGANRQPNSPPWHDGNYDDHRRRDFEHGHRPHKRLQHGDRPYSGSFKRHSRPGREIVIGSGNNGSITIDNDGVDGDGNDVGGNVNN